MAFNTYSDLKRALADWLARSDLTNYLDDFIILGQRRLSRDLRIRAVEKALSITMSSSGTATIPSDFHELKYAYLDGSPTYPLQPKDAEWIHRRYPYRESQGIPQFIAPDSTVFIFGQFPDTTYTVKGTYYFVPTLLSATLTTNEWTDNVDDALFYACLAETAPFLKEDQRVPIWESKYQNIKDGYNREFRHQARKGSITSTR